LCWRGEGSNSQDAGPESHHLASSCRLFPHKGDKNIWQRSPSSFG
jgi:hypothetical protein